MSWDEEIILNRYSTEAVLPHQRNRSWEQIISSTYFPLEVKFRQSDQSRGNLTLWELGEASLSRLSSDALFYKRRRKDLISDTDDHYLATIPITSTATFSQCGSNVTCDPGGFILERSNEPYEFEYPQQNDSWVLKLPVSLLKSRTRSPDHFCTMALDGSKGAGGLFVDMLKLIPTRYTDLADPVKDALCKQLADLLALTLEFNENALTSGSSTVREAHLIRIEYFVRNHLGDSDLGPERIAIASGISTRYLHNLFRDTNQTFGQWVRDLRLQDCRKMLANPRNCQTVAEIAYQMGFSDQAQFSRLFKAIYQITPTDFRKHNAEANTTSKE